MISGPYTKSTSLLCRLTAVFAAVAMVTLVEQSAWAQFGFGFNRNFGSVVGGVSVDADGTVRSSTQQERSGMLRDLRDAVAAPTDDVAAKTSLRMISLSKLQAEIQRAMSEQRPLSEDVLYLAGLQRIEYVFVYPDQHDIVLAGPAEGWVIREDATVVGETTGRPVIQLEDLITAMRVVAETRQQPMSVSIDPTPEGELALRKLLSQIRVGPGFAPAQVEPAMREAFGPQMVSLNSVPSDSRMASTLVAADYRMKRLAMNLEESPVAGLPSYMQMIRNAGASQNTQPRWWMACDYEAIMHSDDMLAWQLTGQGIKAMTEEEIVAATGARQQTGKVNEAAQRWADLFTQKFDELCASNAAFGDLRNVIDLNIVATIIEAHDLEAMASCDLALLQSQTSELSTPSWRTPKTITPECSFVRGRAGWVVSASGGVEINSWQVVATQSRAESGLSGLHAKSEPTGQNWWWN